MDNIVAYYHCDEYKYRKNAVVKSKGVVDVTLNDVSIHVQIKFTTQDAADGRLLPAITAENVHVSINKKKC